MSLCCIVDTVSLISFSGMVSLRKAYGEGVFNSWYSIELYIAFEPFMANQANLSCKWMSEFQADTFTASISIATTSLYPHKLNASQLKNLTNHPHSTVPVQICNLSAGKHAGGLKVEEPSIWSRYNSHCSVCSTCGLISPSSRQESLYGPLCRRHEARSPESHHLKRNSDWQGPQDR